MDVEVSESRDVVSSLLSLFVGLMAFDRNAVNGAAPSVVWGDCDSAGCGDIGAGATVTRDASIIPYSGDRVDNIVVKADTCNLFSCSKILAADFVFILAMRSAANC